MAGPPYRADESSQPNGAVEQRATCEHALRREPGSPLGDAAAAASRRRLGKKACVGPDSSGRTRLHNLCAARCLAR
jgi:hypothetical protein